MPRARDPNIEKAEQLFHEGKKLVEIANQLNCAEGTVRSWKNRYKWNCNATKKKRNVAKRKGGQPGNKNAVGNSGGGPLGNKKAEKYGFFDKYLPDETKEIFDAISQANPLDLLWHQIQIAYAAIVRAQKIAYVKNQQDKTINKIGQKDGDTVTEERWEVQEAWDKQENFLKAQARAQSELRSMIKQYDEMLNNNWEMATEEQKLRIEKTRAEVKQLESNSSSGDGKKYTGIPADMVAPCFSELLHDIADYRHVEYVLPGGRGSTKSSFISLQIIDSIEKNSTMHAVVMRQVADTLRTSVYQQMMWAIDALGLTDEYHCTVSPVEITKKSTGQKIYFRGADDPGKVKSIKVPFGYIGILWLEELDQFCGPEAVRKIEQSVIRGGDIAYIFKSFNPPKSANNWANKYIKIPKENRLVVESNYTQVPAKWLGKPFIDEAEFLKETNPDAYENEYMGVANGSGGLVFDNVQIRAITDEEISQFERPLHGVDWGWFPDPYHYSRSHYDPARLTLYIYMEYRCNKQSNQQTADTLVNDYGITSNDLLICDSAEQKSIGDYKMYGLLARAAEKGPGSVDYSMKWLQSLRAIIIDNQRCPETATEFMDYEYERDKNGEIISGYPDKNNHGIDSVRYATNPIWKKRGQ